MAGLIAVPQSLFFVAYWESILALPLHPSLTLNGLNSVFLVPYSCAHKNLHELFVQAKAAVNYLTVVSVSPDLLKFSKRKMCHLHIHVQFLFLI